MGGMINLSLNYNYCKQTEHVFYTFILHLFINCFRMQNLWKHYKPHYPKFTNKQGTPNQ